MKRSLLVVILTVAALGSFDALGAPPGDTALHVRKSATTGWASFVTAGDGGAIPLRDAPVFRPAEAGDFLREHGKLFGVTDPATQLTESGVHTDALGYKHTSYQQTYKGVAVFGGVLKVHQDAFGAITAANGDFFPITDALDSTPTLTADQAIAKARSHIEDENTAPVVELSKLVVVDPGWYGDPPAGAHLAYHLVLSDLAAGVRDAFFIDAHTGKVLDRWSLLHAVKDRVVIDDTIPAIVRVEGGPATGDFEADGAYDYAGDTYDYLFRAFGRDSLNGAGTTLSTTVHLQSTSCPNAFGGTGGTFFCDGVMTDDIVAHEFGHGLTGFTANLIYQHQSGQLNESFSDVLGEIVDLLNGDAAFAGPPGGTAWPMDPTHVGPGTDTPNDLRTTCVFSTLVTVNSPGSIAGDYGAQAAAFGPSLSDVGVSGDVVVADPARACDADLPFTNAGAMADKIVLVDRGTCFFTEKVRNAQDEGAIAVMVANNLPLGLSPMGGSDASIVIPSVGISQSDGDLIKNEVLSGTVNVTLHSESNTPVRWLVGEDSAGFGGAIRDMWQPSCAGDPDTANDLLQTCSPNDGGGVHSGSGVPNHAFTILVDGKTFNGFTVNPIGLFKAGAVWHRGLTVYLGPASDFQDAYDAFNQSAADLEGTMIKDPRDGSDFGMFTAADSAEVDKALLAVEMNTQGRCGNSQILDTTPPQQCGTLTTIFADDFESGLNGWTVSNTSPPTPYDWVQSSGGLPFARTGTVWFADDPSIGNCDGQDESAVHSLFSPTVALPSVLEDPTLAFTHYVQTETFFDGGNVKISIDGGAWQFIPRTAFTYNAYNGGFSTSGNTNPLAGEEAFTGEPLSSGGFGTSLIDLSGFVTGGEDVQVRLDFGKDGCGGNDGWYVDDFVLYHCPTGGAAMTPPTIGDDVCDGGDNDGLPCSNDADCPGIGGSCGLKSRYVTVVPSNPVVAGAAATTIQVAITDNPLAPSTAGDIWWAGAEQTVADPPNPDLRGALLECTVTPHSQVWTSNELHLFGAAVVPGARYEIRHCDSAGASCSDPLVVETGRWGDVRPPFGAGFEPTFADVSAVVDKFRQLDSAPAMPRTDLVGPGNPGAPNTANQVVSFAEISADVDAFRGFAYPFTVPSCP